MSRALLCDRVSGGDDARVAFLQLARELAPWTPFQTTPPDPSHPGTHIELGSPPAARRASSGSETSSGQNRSRLDYAQRSEPDPTGREPPSKRCSVTGERPRCSTKPASASTNAPLRAHDGPALGRLHEHPAVDGEADSLLCRCERLHDGSVHARLRTSWERLEPIVGLAADQCRWSSMDGHGRVVVGLVNRLQVSSKGVGLGPGARVPAAWRAPARTTPRPVRHLDEPHSVASTAGDRLSREAKEPRTRPRPTPVPRPARQSRSGGYSGRSTRLGHSLGTRAASRWLPLP